MFLLRRTASCWDALACSIPNSPLISATVRSPSRRLSRMEMRKGCAKALKNSALKCRNCETGMYSYIPIRAYANICMSYITRSHTEVNPLWAGLRSPVVSKISGETRRRILLPSGDWRLDICNSGKRLKRVPLPPGEGLAPRQDRTMKTPTGLTFRVRHECGKEIQNPGHKVESA